jgi:hypothetical protein
LGVGQHFTTQECVNAAFFEQRHLFSVAQVSVGLVLDYRRLSSDRGREKPAMRVGLGALFVDLPDDPGRVVRALGGLP